MTGIHALERPHPTLPMGPGRVERREFAYMRHGPLTLLAHFEVAQGTIGVPALGPTRTAADCVAHMARTVAADPEATRWHLVVDNRTMQRSERLVRFVAEHDGLTEDLGQKGTRGVLQSMRTRAAFLSDSSHQMVCHYTPQHASWMNQIELWCSIVARTLLQRASCPSGEDLQA
jgi:transposase